MLALLLISACVGSIEVEPEDTAADTGCDALVRWHADADGDTYGDPLDEVEACLIPDGYVYDDGDCDDDRADIHPGVDDLCNGVDDDCNGTADDGFPDTDADGVADCVDTWCEVEVSPAGEVDALDECEVEDVRVADPWHLVEEWSACDLDVLLLAMPAVGHLDDDNGDGVVGSGDTPEVVLSTRSGLVALDGATGAELFTASPGSNVATLCNAAIADIDGDGEGEALAIFGTGGLWGGPSVRGLRVMAVDGDGSILWQSDSEDDGQTWAYTCALTAADLEGDGLAEVVTDWAVYDGLTGVKLIDLFDPERESDIAFPTVADLDRDGDQEILLGERVYDHEGSLLWSTAVGTMDYFGGTVTLPAQLDGDAEAEVLALYDTTLSAYDTDGTWLYDASLPNTEAVTVPPCMADLDGDGELELGLVTLGGEAVLELDGTVVWSATTADAGFLVGCTAADLDGDGAAELTYYRDAELVVLDGATGAELTSASVSGASARLLDLPVIVDVDADGAAEIVTTVWSSREGCAGVRAFGHDGAGWDEVGTTWGLLDFAEGKQLDDGSITATDWWTDSYRARPAAHLFEGAYELSIELVDACVASCDGGPVRLSWQVANVGGNPAPDSGSWVELWDGDVLLSKSTIPALGPGEAMAGAVSELWLSALSGADLVLRVGNFGGGECLGDEDEVRWTLPCE